MLTQLHQRAVKFGPQLLRLPAQMIPFSLQRLLLEHALNSILAPNIEDEELDSTYYNKTKP